MKIVSLAPSNTELVFALGAQDELVGVTRFCDYPPEAITKPTLGGWLDADILKVRDLKPDLVLTSTFLQNKVAAHLQELGIAVVHVDPKTVAEVLDSFITIGTAIGRQDAAEALVARITAGLDQLRQHTSTLTKPRVYIEEWHKPPTVSGNWVPELLTIAGGSSDLVVSGARSTEVDTEEIVRFDPQYIIASWCGFGANAKKEWITEREGYGNITAIKEGNVYVVDDSLLNRPGPRIVEGARLLARILHKT